MSSPSLTSEPLISVTGLKRWFKVRGGIFSGIRRPAKYVKAVDGITLQIHPGEVLSLVGESGCGKSTFARILLGILKPEEGQVLFDGADIFSANGKQMTRIRTEMQAVFQDPYGSLDPKKTIPETVLEPLVVNRISNEPEAKYQRYSSSMNAVGLDPSLFLDKFPYELSGGQRQRVAIARAIVIEPRFIIADEPVSMLDVSVRAEILSLLLDLQRKFRLTYLFITHDLAVARYISDRMAVMYLGRIVEIGSSDEVCDAPAHPYTKALLSAVPTTDPRARGRRLDLKGDISVGGETSNACRFMPRCPYAFDKCAKEPDLIRVGKQHYAACYLAEPS